MTDPAYEKRFSDHTAFWVICGLAVLAIHVFFYFRIRAAFGTGIPSVLWLGWSLAMMELSFLSRRTGKIRSGAQRRWTDRLCGVWMLYVLISFIALMVLDAAAYIVSVTPPEHGLLLAFALGAVIVGMGIRQANNVQTVVMNVYTDKLPQGCKSLRVVQLTDLHLGPWTGIALLEQIVRKVCDANPDIVVVTGDLVDGRLEGRELEIEILRRIKPKYGVFAVTGNHDYYDDVYDSVDFMEAAGMKVLCTEGAYVGGIIIVGADDRDHLIRQQWGLTRSETLVLSFEREQREKFLLLLRHRPIIEAGTEGHFDLQLSGHTHGGQLFPLFSSRSKIAGHGRGLKKLKRGGFLYVSNGAGFVGPPVRLMAPPEIAAFDIISKS